MSESSSAEHVRYRQDPDGVVTLTLDLPGSANVMNAQYRDAMGAAVARLAAERERITGVVITSAKKTFFAGGDLTALIQVTEENAAEFAAGLTEIKAQLRTLETLGRPVVAAVNGSALGGGLELALACHHRVCLDDEGIRIGLPEATLGLLPGGGGITRSVRMMGVQAALPLLTEGRQLRPAKALAVGWIDELASDRDELMAKARAWLLAHPDAAQPWDAPGHRVPDLRPLDPESYPLLAAAPAVLHRKTHGCYPAVERILAAAVEGALLDLDTALQVETQYLTELVTGQVAKNMISTFWFQLNEVNAGGSRPAGHPASSVRRVGVLGAGMMGAGIAHVSALAGIEVVLKDATVEAAVRGRDSITALLDKDVARGKLTEDQKQSLLDLITVTGDDADLGGCDLVIEAVFEDRELKNTVLAAAEAAALPGAVIASNTSTLPITGLAQAVAEPERFVGLHFFSPVRRMPLVEIIRGEKTSPETLARAFDFVRQIRKTPIVVNDSRGFYTSRTFGTYLTEGIAMVGEGVPAALVENVARKAGMAVGPLAVCDEVSLTLPLRIRDQALADLAEAGAEVEAEAETGTGGGADAARDGLAQLRQHPAYEVLQAMTAEYGRAGRAAGAGFYDYPAGDADGGRKSLWPGLAERWAAPGRPLPPEQDVRDRLLYIQALETVRILEESVLTSVADANIGSVLGIGFAPWSGGTLQFVNSVGPAAFTARADQLADAYGERFRPSALLREKAARDERF
ncbi:3-hydroxyacyl-CoA dehydrogenase [Streptacidiphilus sp. PB12-B1b]|uniref:3-hydroxyacyl-CoA dehydrogenase NAD-binding domain-containing protein n=1 Tax=Streptacidiphilus sp. PB12-B1b TaxID=2705012 RepID=UPI0015F994F9|nr:3-hydroxyacyl-CoA dehydrogenase NAD-binding domain-containing protein [Streptacidiphilus sp. PB12-B1b]QMU76998.1 3-hydroxyacyl-CoA dehydrogenase [Streptacidiphilus sp. PB12-B1b]